MSDGLTIKEATYTTRPATNDKNHGTFYYTSCCGNRLYSVRGKMAYDGALCPSCQYYHKRVILKFDSGYDWGDIEGNDY